MSKVEISLTAGDWTETVKIGKVWLNQEPNNPLPHFALNVSYNYLGDRDNRSKHVSHAYGAKDRVDKIRLWTKSLITKDPKSPYVYLLAGIAHDDDFKQAIQYYKKSIDLNPKIKWSYLALGMAYMSNGYLNEAIETSVKILKFSPDDASVYMLMGNAMIIGKEFENGRRFFEKTVGLDPQNTEAHYNLAMSYLTLGSRPKAVKHLYKVIELEPESNIASDARVHIDKLEK